MFPFRIVCPRSTRRFGLATVLAVSLVLAGFVLGPFNIRSAQAGEAPVIISSATARGVVNQSFNYQIVLANFAKGTYSAVGLPAGLTLDAKVGAISGIPTVIDTFNVQLTATNADGTATSTLALTVEPAEPPKFNVIGVVTAVSGRPFSYQIAATNKPTDYRVEGLPEGLVLNTEVGLITGVPTKTGAFPLALSATNVRGSATGALTLSIVPAIPAVTLTADIPVANPVRGEIGQFTLTRDGGDLTQPLTVVFSVKGSARSGLDYQTLSLSKNFKAGKSVKRIHIIPLNDDANTVDSKKVVKLTIEGSDAYTVNGNVVGKVKIEYGP